MSQLAFFYVFLIPSLCLILTTHIVEGTTCGSGELIGPLNENGQSEHLLERRANLSDTIVIKWQLTLNNTDHDVEDMKYNPWLKIYFTNRRDGKELYGFFRRGGEFYIERIPVGNKINYSVNITVNVTLDRSVIFCGVDIAHRLPQTVQERCYTGSAAIIIIEDNDPCITSTTSPETPTTIPSTTISSTTSTPDKPTTNPTTSLPITTKTPKTLTTPTNPASTTSPPTADSGNVTVNKVVLFPVVGIATLVGIILLVANCIQLWVIIMIIKNRRAAKTVNISATNGIALDHFSAELGQHGTDQNGVESEEDTATIQNSAATESG